MLVLQIDSLTQIGTCKRAATKEFKGVQNGWVHFYSILIVVLILVFFSLFGVHTQDEYSNIWLNILWTSQLRSFLNDSQYILFAAKPAHMHIVWSD